MKFESVIGLEIHAQLKTATKLFCACPNQFGDKPNIHTCERCLGMPGVLPRLNEEAVNLAVKAALALSCEVQKRSQWSRKNYFYPDLPKGYQISQFDQPYARHGNLSVETAHGLRAVRIGRIHMEEDAGKNVHDDVGVSNRSYVDFNRGGTPLVEIVTDPDLRHASEASAFTRKVRNILRTIEVCDGNMEEGSLRCDANVSIRAVGDEKLGVRCEIKNLNSFRFLEQAIEYEIDRQIDVIESGGEVAQETKLWDPTNRVTRTMRTKEDAHDYRYFPEPDLPDLFLDEDVIAGIKNTIPELPHQTYTRYVNEFALNEEEARLLSDNPDMKTFYEDAISRHANYKGVANWVTNELIRELKGRDLEALPFKGREIGQLVGLIDEGVISGKIGKEVLIHLIAQGGTPQDIVEKRGLRQVKDEQSLKPLVEQVVERNPHSVKDYHDGKTKVIGFLVGQVMKESRGKANPAMVNTLLKELLDEKDG
jgi:aspartyl-tRNA(Asn)/glutamyl-tRNA(Gln) amidotransferase subunit B